MSDPILAIAFDSEQELEDFLARHGQTLDSETVNCDPYELAKVMEQDVGERYGSSWY